MIALEHAAALLAAIVTVLAALPLAAAICFALGGFACATLLVAVIAMFVFAFGMVKRRRTRRPADPYARAFGDFPHNRFWDGR
ncbi:MAG TPA: hypothetical protein PL193_07780 [Xanthobacteraceae bacterium]|nr:hypothetical protein [Xanthobacteraceae bacterium]